MCILNSDIELIIKNESILKELNKSSCFFLTRHEVDNTRPLIDNFCGSHDAYLFNSNVLNKKIQNLDNEDELNYINFKQNTFGIESFEELSFVKKS